MKKTILMACAAVLGLSFASCKQDTQPRLNTPTEFVLNTPAMAEQVYQPTAESTVEFTVSQPNYGLATTPTYQIEVAKEANGFDKGEYQVVEGTTTSAKISLSGEYFCIALCKLYNYTSLDNFSDAPRPVYVRAHATVANAEYADIYSNVIVLKQVQPYFAVKLPDQIWLVGDCEGWSAAPNDAWVLTETEPESLIYTGTFYIPEGKFQFRFYDQFDAAEPWEWYSIGSQDDDAAIEIAFEDGVYSGDCTYNFSAAKAGKGSWMVSGWPGGNVAMTVNLGTKKIVFEIVD
jgi:hypothetical protein